MQSMRPWAILGLLLLILLKLAKGDIERLLLPIKPGLDVGLAIIPGAFVKAEQYFMIAGEFQEASDYALWIYVEDSPSATFPPRQDLVITAKTALQEAGLPGDAPFISIGHSMGGAFMMIELNESPELVDGLITWGADGFVLPDNIGILQVPGLTMAGDLDGLTRITDMAEQFRKLSSLPRDQRLKYPVRTLEGLNHMSFTTGEPPLSPRLRDLPPEIEGEEARSIIIEECLFYIDYCIRLKFDQDVSEHLKRLDNWLNYQEEVYTPIINAMLLESTPDGSESPWVKEAQRIIGEVSENEVVVENYAMGKVDLVYSKPDVVRLENEVLANTTTYLDSNFPWSSVKSLEAKLSSKEIFDVVLGRNSTGNGPDCKDVNMAAWDRIYPTISDLARRRYDAREYTVNFKEDKQQVWGPGWIFSSTEFDSDGQSLNITSSSLQTSVALGGAHYCKLLSPFRVIEFLYIDSLRPNGF